MNDVEKLVARIRQVAYDLHVYLGTGLLEKVYENGLAHRLQKEGLRVETQKPLSVYDRDGFCLGEYFADLVVEDRIVVELKSVRSIANEHYVQILNYLKITGAPAGLLINFGSYKFEVRTVIPRSSPPPPRLHGQEKPPSPPSPLLHGQEKSPSPPSPLLHGQEKSPSPPSPLLHG